MRCLLVFVCCVCVVFAGGGAVCGLLRVAFIALCVVFKMLVAGSFVVCWFQIVVFKLLFVFVVV